MSNQSKRTNQNEGVRYTDPHTYIDMHGEHKVFNQENSRIIMLENDQIPAPQVAEAKVGTRSRSNKASRKSTTTTTRSSTKKSVVKNSGKVVRSINQTSGGIATGVMNNVSSSVGSNSNKVEERFRAPNADGIGTSAWDSDSPDPGLDVVINKSSDKLMIGARTLRRALMDPPSSKVEYNARPTVEYLEPEYIEDSEKSSPSEDVDIRSPDQKALDNLKAFGNLTNIKVTIKELFETFKIMRLFDWLTRDGEFVKSFVECVPYRILPSEEDTMSDLKLKESIHDTLSTMRETDDYAFQQAFQSALRYLDVTLIHDLSINEEHLRLTLDSLLNPKLHDNTTTTPYVIPKKTLEGWHEEADTQLVGSKTKSSTPIIATQEVPSVRGEQSMIKETNDDTLNQRLFSMSPMQTLLHKKVLEADNLQRSVTVIQSSDIGKHVVNDILTVKSLKETLERIKAQLRSNIEPEWKSFFTAIATKLVSKMLFTHID